MKSFKFDDVTVQQMFGHEAAEDEDKARLREYYFKSGVFGRVSADLAIRILVGHKGTGKSALLSVAMQEDADAGILALLIKPDDVSEIQTKPTDMLESIRNWKVGLERIIYKKCLSAAQIGENDLKERFAQGTRIVDFLAEAFGPLLKKNANLPAVTQAVAKGIVGGRKVRIYLDDLDRGWTASRESILRLSALINALRDLIQNQPGLQFRVSLRSDVYFLVRTSDESTDKIEGSVVWLGWDNHEILALLVKRVEAFFGRHRDESELTRMNQHDLGALLGSVMEARFHGRGKWKDIPTYRVLMSVVRRRPRDIVKLCTLAAQSAGKAGRSMISTEDFDGIFEQYSQGRLQDAVNEFRSELPTIEVLLLNMRPSAQRRGTTSAYLYTTADLLKKIGNIASNQVFSFYGGRRAEPKDLAAFLYKINFLTARKNTGERITRRYFEEQKYLSSAFVDFGFDWEIHSAYRWALQPDNPRDIFNSCDPDSGEV